MIQRKKQPRKKVQSDTEAAVLAKSARRCTLCFHLKGDLSEKIGQIAHLDDNPANNKEDNLAWMCLEHHCTYDSKTKQHKNYTLREVKTARAKLHGIVAEGKHLAQSHTPSSVSQVEADKKTLHDLLAVVPSNGAMKFLRSNNFGFSFDWRDLDEVATFFHDRSGPDHEFLDEQLEAARMRFRESCGTLLSTLALNTFPTNGEHRSAVPDEWEIEDPKRFHKTIRAIHSASDAVCGAYDDLVRLARQKLGR